MERLKILLNWRYTLFGVPAGILGIVAIFGYSLELHLLIFGIIFYLFLLTSLFSFLFFAEDENLPKKERAFPVFKMALTLPLTLGLLLYAAVLFILSFSVFAPLSLWDRFLYPGMVFITATFFAILGLYIGAYHSIVEGLFREALADIGKGMVCLALCKAIPWLLRTPGNMPVGLLLGIGCIIALVGIFRYAISIEEALNQGELKVRYLEIQTRKVREILDNFITKCGEEIRFGKPSTEGNLCSLPIEADRMSLALEVAVRSWKKAKVDLKMHDADDYLCLADSLQSKIKFPKRIYLGEFKIHKNILDDLNQKFSEEVGKLQRSIEGLVTDFTTCLENTRRMRLIDFKGGFIRVNKRRRVLALNATVGEYLRGSDFSPEKYLFKKISTLDMAFPHVRRLRDPASTPPNSTALDTSRRMSRILEHLLDSLEQNRTTPIVEEFQIPGPRRRCLRFTCSTSSPCKETKNSCQYSRCCENQCEILIQDISQTRGKEEILYKVLSPHILNKSNLWERVDRHARKEIAILFGDLRGFSRLSDSVDPPVLARILNTFFPPLIQKAFEYEAVVNQLVGDEIMVLLGVYSNMKDYAMRAVELALDMAQCHNATCARIRQENWFPQDVELPLFGFGVNVGEVVLGFLGSEQFMYYTAVGKPVNLAHRICDIAPGGEVYISQYCKDRLPPTTPKFTVSLLGTYTFSGFATPVDVYSSTAMPGCP